MRTATYKGSDGIVLTYDMSKGADDIVDWITDIHTRRCSSPLYIVGNNFELFCIGSFQYLYLNYLGCKSDISRRSSRLVAQRVSLARGYPCFETSIYNPSSVADVIYGIVHRLLIIKYPTTYLENVAEACTCVSACNIS